MGSSKMYLFTILLVLAESLEAAMSMLSCVIIDHSGLKSQHWDFPGSPLVKTALPLQRVRV